MVYSYGTSRYFRADNVYEYVWCRLTELGIVIADITPTECGARLHVLKKLLRSVQLYRNFLTFSPQYSMVFSYGPGS